MPSSASPRLLGQGLRRLAVGLTSSALAVLLFGCGGQSASSGQSPTTAATPSATVSAGFPSAGVSSPAAASRSASASASSSAAHKVGDICKSLPAAKVSTIVGATMKSNGTSIGLSSLCVYTPASATGLSVTAQGIPATAGLDQFTTQLQKRFSGSTVTDVQIPGADQAKLISAKVGTVAISDILLIAGGVFYQALVTSSPKSDAYAKAIAAELVAA